MRVILSCILFFVTILSNAQTSGILDNTFGSAGKVFTKIVNSGIPFSDFNRSHAVAVSNNRIYVAGGSSSTSSGGIGVAAYTLNGSLDPSFDGDGKKLIDPGSQDGIALDVMTQSDGKIIAAGFTSNDFLIVRMNTNGSLDTSWGGTGIVKTDLTGTWERITRVAIQSDGKIIAAGYSGTNVNDLTVARYNANGTLDTSFGVNGFLNKDLQAGGAERIEGMTIQADDKILLVGTSSSASTGGDGFIMRLTKDGLYDVSFNSVGYAIINYGGNESLSGVAIQPDSKIIASGVKNAGTSGVYRFNANGSIDSAFGSAGFADSNVAMWSSNIYYHSAVKIVVFGYTYGLPSRDFAITSFNLKGENDLCFGTNGLAKVDMGNATEDYGFKGVIQSDGKLLITGQYDNSSQFALARFTGPSPYIDNSISLIGDAITVAESGAAYSWIDCISNQVMAGASGQTYTPGLPGKYKAMVTKYGCTVRSICIDYKIESNYKELLDNTLNNTTGPSLGQAWGDYNKDGFDDLLVVNYAGYESFLFKNNGNKTFTRILGDPVVTDKGDSYAGSWGDYDNDGLLDLFIGNYSGKNFLYHNLNGNSFEKITTGSVANDITNLWDACWVDYNNDGLLDVFQATNNNNFLYKNLGNGQFERITSGSIVTDSEASFSCAWGDYNNDGFIDLFVPNFGNQNNSLYKNLGNGAFQKITVGSIVNDGGQSRSASWGDYNNDGFLDLYVTNSGQKNFLYKNNGDETFTKITNDPVVNQSNWSFSSTWTDYNNDGYIDLAVSRSTDTDSVSLFKNNRDGSFSRIVDSSLIATGTSSWSISASDFDNNGYEDLYVAGRGFHKGYLFENRNSGNNYVGVSLIGSTSNKAGIGSRVKVKSNGFWQTKQVSGNTGRASQGSMRLNFGVAKSSTIDSLIVFWPGNKRQLLINRPANQIIQIKECQSYSVSLQKQICTGDSFVFGMDVLKTDGQYSKKFISIFGCDSTVVINLKLKPVYKDIQVAASICQGEVYKFGTKTLSLSGSYTETFKTILGCDSTVNLNLAVKAISNAVNQEGTKLIAQQVGASYQWIKCNSGASIPSATEITYSPIETGSYGVVIKKDGCSITSECLNVIILSASIEYAQKVVAYPNPTNNKLFIKLGERCAWVNVSLQEISGKQIETFRFQYIELAEINLETLASGIYFVEIETEKGKVFARVVKQ
jgi:uncharacterized delta-60 repeat protein